MDSTVFDWFFCNLIAQSDLKRTCTQYICYLLLNISLHISSEALIWRWKPCMHVCLGPCGKTKIVFLTTHKDNTVLQETKQLSSRLTVLKKLFSYALFFRHWSIPNSLKCPFPFQCPVTSVTCSIVGPSWFSFLKKYCALFLTIFPLSQVKNIFFMAKRPV